MLLAGTTAGIARWLEERASWDPWRGRIAGEPELFEEPLDEPSADASDVAAAAAIRRSGGHPEEVRRQVLAKPTAPAPLSGRPGQKPKGSYGAPRGPWRLFGQPVPRCEDPGAAAGASSGAASPPGVAIETGWHSQPRAGEAWRRGP